MPRKQKNITSNIALSIVTVITVLSVMEVVLRIGYPFFKNYNMEMWRYASKIKVSSDNEKVSHEHGSNRSGVFYGVEIQTNSDGFRDYEYPKKKAPGTYRIVMLGDSITLGWGVAFEDTFSKRIEKKLNEMAGDTKFEVINTGIGNYNTFMELELLKSKGVKYDPDLIVLNYYINDAEIIHRISTFAYMVKRTFYVYAFFWDKMSNLLVRFKDNNYSNFYSALYDNSFAGNKRMLQSLDELGGIAKRNNIDLMFAVYPEFHNFKEYEFHYVTDSVRNSASKNGAYFLDLLPYFKDENPEAIWVSHEDAHPNARGHKIAANAITEYLIKSKLIPTEKGNNKASSS